MRRLLRVSVVLCVWIPASGALAQGSVSIDRDWTLVSSQRFSRTHFDYIYRVSASNAGSQEAVQVGAAASSLVGTTHLIDANVDFGTIAAGATAPSMDTFTIRVDRTRPFDRSQIVWTVRATEPAAGALLEGASTAPASSSLVNLEQISGPEESHVGLDERGARIARTELWIQLEPAATVGEINGLLRGFGARIVWMMPDVPQLVIEFPDPGDVQALNRLIAQLRASPAIALVLPAYFPAVSALPLHYDPSTLDGFSAIDHLLGVGAAAAWNARAGLTPAAPPTVLVVDYFGDGAVFSPPFGVHVSTPFFFSRTTYDFKPDATGHGYHVLGIIGADFGGEPATGVFPAIAAGPLDVEVIDIGLDPRPEPRPAGRRLMSMIDIQATLLHRLRFNLANRPVVVNTSIGFNCHDERTDPPSPVACDTTMVEEYGLAWAEAVRAANLEGSFVHITAAGNEMAPGDVDAAYASPFAAAALLPLVDASGNAVANLTNTLVVENLTQSPTPPYAPTCLWGGYASTSGSAVGGSKVGGNLGAVGTEVFSYIAPSRFTDSWSGTSMASPVVAGTAAYLWTFSPALSPDEIKGILVATARPLEPFAPEDRPEDCRAIAEDAAPALDVYSALLRADRPAALIAGGNPTEAPVRSAVLDVADSLGQPGGDGVFDGGDLMRFAQELSVPAGTAGCGGYDWSRYDLNGNGRTGGCRTERFDLDANGALGSARQGIAGAPVDFNETALSDIEVLCYYAYSPLYRGTADQRELPLRGVCDVSPQVVTLAQWPARTASITTCDSTYGCEGGEREYYYDSTEVEVSVDSSGTAVTAWSEPEGFTLAKITSIHPSPDPNGLDSWEEYPCTSSTRLAVRAARSVPGLPLEVVDLQHREGSGLRLADTAVATSETGAALVVWTIVDYDDCRFYPGMEQYGAMGQNIEPVRMTVFASVYDPNAGWSAPVELWRDESGPRGGGGGSYGNLWSIGEVYSADSRSIRAFLDRAGNAIVVWSAGWSSFVKFQGTSSRVALFSRTFRPASGWGPTTTVYEEAGPPPPNSFSTLRLVSQAMTPQGMVATLIQTHSSYRALLGSAEDGWLSSQAMPELRLREGEQAVISADAGGSVLVSGTTTGNAPFAQWWVPLAGWLPPQPSDWLPTGLRNARVGLAGDILAWSSTSAAYFDPDEVRWSEPLGLLGLPGEGPLLSNSYGACGCGGEVTDYGFTYQSGDDTYHLQARRLSLSKGATGPTSEVYATDPPDYGDAVRLFIAGGADGSCGAPVLAGRVVEYGWGGESQTRTTTAAIARLGLPSPPAPTAPASAP